MLDKLDNELRFQQGALQLLSQRQDILSANIANADTPGYQARDIDFSQQLKNAVERGDLKKSEGVNLALTSGKHIPAAAPPFDNNQLLYRVPDQPSADGNTVDMDRERVNYADNTVKYQTSLTILSSQLKNMMTVISQG
ncbi:flagellar basal body rod protein FlgB (plasmid) [Hafnia alvei]|uniref:flagellar basal body rod protein FlgB n=1 Tax=Hafnia alvei TaxID=569 RepID=UPI0028BF451F|nr:flagellar basal body rod protein FlgB [Hafnia alvei]WNN54711.1 flagellar basal body rod protein FlgB [Hafnia alvei]